MKNFEAHYSVVGTAALKVDASEQQIQAPIIEFPLSHARSNGQHATQDRRMKMVDLALMRELRTGSVQGKGLAASLLGSRCLPASFLPRALSPLFSSACNRLIRLPRKLRSAGSCVRAPVIRGAFLFRWLSLSPDCDSREAAGFTIEIAP